MTDITCGMFTYERSLECMIGSWTLGYSRDFADCRIDSWHRDNLARDAAALFDDHRSRQGAARQGAINLCQQWIHHSLKTGGWQGEERRVEIPIVYVTGRLVLDAGWVGSTRSATSLGKIILCRGSRLRGRRGLRRSTFPASSLRATFGGWETRWLGRSCRGIQRRSLRSYPL